MSMYSLKLKHYFALARMKGQGWVMSRTSGANGHALAHMVRLGLVERRVQRWLKWPQYRITPAGVVVLVNEIKRIQSARGCNNTVPKAIMESEQLLLSEWGSHEL